ncbi:sugar O-acyltransferase, sialic acid O-acetyltransferase NeuD family [Selenomonas ruminantium]|uniref:Sugar O-acyltransferase, sialic acid O-acetyltransferase NeuD family n=1 Tax=Selenomonas ruminantium TaxID=971 RepID=A0A1M6W1X0_SELRU|nr:NeuD/PglB/VioB family sugar acetyltransferase [Selenomonas ruminantium]SHK87762.1 sugar O-acyltransferase, sialic acid O-acetyltransferase NeuD family [Selenomonas ruminantium]
MKHLIIIGVGGFAREVYWHAQDSFGYGEEWDLKGFLDGDVRLDMEEYEKLELPVLGDINSYEIAEDDVFFCAIGNGQVRKKIVESVLVKEAKFISLIHNTAIIQGNVSYGTGVMFGPRTCVGDHAVIGDFVILNTASAVGHDARIDDYVSIMSYVDITGYSQLEEGVMFGSGARILPHGRVGAYATVGAGSVVLRKVKPSTTVFGNPAVPIVK